MYKTRSSVKERLGYQHQPYRKNTDEIETENNIDNNVSMRVHYLHGYV
jgi:hypothetical protein